jgi:hypothetical protein
MLECDIGRMIAMRLSNPDLPLLPLLAPIFLVGLGPLLFLPLVGPFGIAVVGLLIGSAAIMAQMEEQGEHARQIVAHGFGPEGEQVCYRATMTSLMRTLLAAKVVAAALIVVGIGGLLLGK